MSESTPAASDDTPGKSNENDDLDFKNSPASPRRAGSVSGSSHPHSLNSRSCVTCRRRKVRCDKRNPCGNCTKQGIECIFPGPGRAPRKARKPPDTELLTRLRRLEGVVKSLGVGVDEDGGVTQMATGTPRAMSGIFGNTGMSSGAPSAEGSPEARGGEKDSHRSSIDKHLGRLVINEGRSRYVSNVFWASMGDEIAEMRDILDAPSSEEEDDFASPIQSGAGASSPASHQAFIFGYSSAMLDLKRLHPSPSQIFILWEVFKENVDPLVRILHRPTAKHILLNASSNVDSVSKAAEALLFAIYFGAVVSLEESQCQSLLGESKQALANRYRFATEQALARAGFLNSSSLMVLQAFVFFLVCVRHQDDTRLVWALSGLAIHLAQALGIHRDGSNFGLGPFETEMRRRLWWHISILDTRSSEDHGTDPTFSEQFYDTKLPMNINDDDIYPEMKEPPKERKGCTEMTFCLLRFELSTTTRRLNFVPPGANADQTHEETIRWKEQLIDECHKKIEEKYLQYCDMNVPIFWVSATVGRLVLAKMWLMAHHPFSFAKSGELDAPSQGLRDRLFITSVEVIEFSYLLEKNENTMKWGWLFRTYMQWHAVAFVLSELCIRPPGPDYERAWRAVESVYDNRVIDNPRNQKGMLWKPMRQLMLRAKARQARLAKNPWVSSDTGSLAESAPITIASPTNSFFSPFPGTTVIQTTAEALGMDFDNETMNGLGGMGGASNMAGPLANGPIPQTAMTDEEVQNWLANEPVLQQNPDFLGWPGWSPGVGDFPMQPLNDFTMSDAKQEWF